MDREVRRLTNRPLFSKRVLDFTFSENDSNIVAEVLLKAGHPLEDKAFPFCAIFDGSITGSRTCEGCPVASFDYHCLDSRSFIMKAKYNGVLQRNMEKLTANMNNTQRLIREEKDG
ncbi:hypothetical protein JHD46_05330 [Sulfurimonas sp. SAG-AH-194-C20]|nr:hypothetical protein [Sulfurimonas sp. SAG-AH-194-C20]MDF1879061.1 hypothetical protein [Sulfurimonas sp. SAG-AH-194-C20]